MKLFRIFVKLPWAIGRHIFTLLYLYQLFLWQIGGKKPPYPQLLKAKTLLQTAKKYHLKVFIETGTYLGYTVQMTRSRFDKVYTIELDKELAKRAKRIFAHNKRVTVIQGDSGKELKKILHKTKKPALFWLDAHYSGGVTSKGGKETPIVEELKVIAKHKIKSHVILVDDARHFTGGAGYPNLAELKTFVRKNFANKRFLVKNDIIEIFPK